MKLTIRILNEPTGHRRHRRVYTRRRNEYIFEANPKTGRYEYTLDCDTPEQMQESLDAIFEAGRSCLYALTIVIDKDAFHAVTATPRAPVEEYIVPEYSELDEQGLRKVCNDLGIPHNERNTETGLREKLELFHLAQTRVIERYCLPDDAEGEKPNPDTVDKEKSRADAEKAAEAEALAAKQAEEEAQRSKEMPESQVLLLGKEELEEYVEGFTDAEALRALVERLTGEKIDKRKNLANTKVYAIRHISYKQVELVAESKKGQTKE